MPSFKPQNCLWSAPFDVLDQHFELHLELPIVSYFCNMKWSAYVFKFDINYFLNYQLLKFSPSNWIINYQD